MTSVFADTFYFLALLNRADEAHGRARGFVGSGRTLVTTLWVLTEVADALASTRNRPVLRDLLESLEVDDGVEIADEPGLWRAGLALYAQRLDKEWTLTDCISFVAMERRQLSEALTGDHHFEQAGFVALLKA